MNIETGETFHERYRVERALGRGAAGAVYEVVDQSTQARRALKVLHPDTLTDEDQRIRFRREATVSSRFRSEHVVETLDAGIEQRGWPFLVLKLLRGEDLSVVLRRRGRLPAGEVGVVVRQTTEGLEAAHAAGVIHRDLKPQNLYATYPNGLVLKLLDFGIAKVFGNTLGGQHTKGIVGTPLYMAPEQMHGEIAASPATDVYALGHIVYHLVVGEPYFAPEQEAAREVYELLVATIGGPREAPSERARQRRGIELPAAFDHWFNHATAADPSDRFASARAACDAWTMDLDAPLREPPADANALAWLADDLGLPMPLSREVASTLMGQLEALRSTYPSKAEVVELRYWQRLTPHEIADRRDSGDATKDFRFARAWLKKRLPH